MRITEITEMGKSRSKVYIDQEFAFVLYRGELRRYHIKEGEELSEDVYRAIMEEVLPKRAKLRAMNLLTRRDYTVSQLRAKLAQGGYPPEVVEAALAYVASFHYTDDLRYAMDYINGCAAVRSRRRIEQDLARRGISQETVQRAWQEWEDHGGAQNEEQMIRELLQKRRFDHAAADHCEVRKQAAYLMRKGYGIDSIRRAFRECGGDNLDDVQSFT